VRRMTETTKWADPWFRNLSPDLKLFWLWLVDSCDCAGILDVDMPLAQFQIGASKALPSPLEAFPGRVISLAGGKVLVSKFIGFQYGDKLNPANSAHRGVIKRLSIAGIGMNGDIPDIPNAEIQGPSKGLCRGYQAPQDKDKDMDKVTDQDQDSEISPRKPHGQAALANAIYDAYPRKQGRKAAIAKILAAIAGHSAEVVMDATKAYAHATASWPDDERQFIPHPATWYGQERFLDDRATWQRKPKGQAVRTLESYEPTYQTDENGDVKF